MCSSLKFGADERFGSRMLGKHAQASTGSNTDSSAFDKTAAITVDVFRFHGKTASVSPYKFTSPAYIIAGKGGGAQ
jgi:hypothetical protein